MADLWTVLASIDWARVVGDVLVPAAAILVSTLVAVRLARDERRDNRESLRIERMLAAFPPLWEDLAQLVSLDPFREDFAPVLRAMRAHITVARASMYLGDDALVSDWLALRHREGMSLWGQAMESATTAMTATITIRKLDEELIDQARRWANETAQLLQGWLTNDVDVEWFRRDGARIIENYGAGEPLPGFTQT